MNPWEMRDDSYRIDWAGRSWSLTPSNELPGLRCDDAPIGPLLSLAGLAEPGRWQADALSGSALVGVEQHFGRLSATYCPSAWGALTVKATWWLSEPDAIDLEVEVSARSVGRLISLEAMVRSLIGDKPPNGMRLDVSPRDARAATLSYDGRESDLNRLTTEPPAAPLTPWLVPRTSIAAMTYAELAHPHDVSRRIQEGGLPITAMRYALFGHDLERGVVLRGRLRGVWLPKDSAFSQAETRWRAFLNEPPNLTR